MSTWSRSNAKRGDLAVTSTRVSSYSQSLGVEWRDEHRLAVVTSITREGRVKAFRLLDSDTPIPLDRFTRGLVKHFPREDVNADALIGEAMGHKWPGHEESSLLMPYGDIATVRELVSRHRVQV